MSGFTLPEFEISVVNGILFLLLMKLKNDKDLSFFRNNELDILDNLDSLLWKKWFF